MKLYTIAWQNRPLVCLENRPGRLTPLPYETMNLENERLNSV